MAARWVENPSPILWFVCWITPVSRIEKSVFVSYRRASSSVWALAISQKLTQHGFDVFFDYQSIASGDFERVIIENIRTRAHFLVLLTPSALERIDESGDWLRREIEAALEHRRNIVPLMVEGFDFATPSIGSRLTGTLEPLKSYNGLSVPVEYFDAAMERLMTRHLNVAVDEVRHPASLLSRDAAKQQQAAVQAAPAVTTQELTAERWFERAFEATDVEKKLEFYTEAIRLNPDFSEAFNNRGIVRKAKGDLDGALADYAEAIQLNPGYPNAFNNRGNVREAKGDLDGALAEYAEAIRLKPDYPDALYNRGVVRQAKGDLDGALADYAEAIRLKPDYTNAFYNRGKLKKVLRDHSGAVADLQKYLDLGGGERDGDQSAVEEEIRKLLQNKTP